MADYPAAPSTFPSTPTPSTTTVATDVGGRTHSERHDAVEAEVVAVQTDLIDARSQGGGFANVSAALAGLWAAITGKANTSHTHAPGEVTGTAVVDGDARLSDARTPLAHALTHALGGTDELLLDPAQIDGLAALLAAKATPADIAAALSALVGDAPELLDTLGEIADALGDDPNLATTLTTAIGIAQASADAAQTAIDDHEAQATGAHAGTAVSVDPSGLVVVSGTNVQSALAQLDAAHAALGGAAALDVGTTAGTVMAGNDARALRVPDPTAEGDGRVLEVASGALVYADPSGGGGTGVWHTGTAAPTTQGNDGDWYLRRPSMTYPNVSIYGPKAGGSWPTSPFWVGRQVPSGVSPVAGLGTNGVGITLPLGLFANTSGAVIPASFTVQTNVQTNPSPVGVKRGAAASRGEYGINLWSSSGDPPVIAVAALAATIGALPGAGRVNLGVQNPTFGAGLVASLDSSGNVYGRSLAVGSDVAGPIIGVLADDTITYVVNGGVLTITAMSAANVLRGQIVLNRKPSLDTAFGNNASIVFDSTTDTAARITSFLAAT